MKEDLYKKQGNMEEANRQSYWRCQMTRQARDKEEGEHQLRVRGLCGCCLFQPHALAHIFPPATGTSEARPTYSRYNVACYKEARLFISGCRNGCSLLF